MSSKLRSSLFWLGGLSLVAAGAVALTACSHAKENAPQVVSKVDLERYLGTWYEIARLPLRVQEGCHATTATYTKREDGRIGVLNKCYKDSFNGPLKEAEGVAWVVDEQTNAKLKVQFFWPFSGDYWILGLDQEDYQWALVGSPDRENMWILSRTPTISPERKALILSIARRKGFDVEALIYTPQPKPS